MAAVVEQLLDRYPQIVCALLRARQEVASKSKPHEITVGGIPQFDEPRILMNYLKMEPMSLNGYAATVIYYKDNMYTLECKQLRLHGVFRISKTMFLLMLFSASERVDLGVLNYGWNMLQEQLRAYLSLSSNVDFQWNCVDMFGLRLQTISKSVQLGAQQLMLVALLRDPPQEEYIASVLRGVDPAVLTLVMREGNTLLAGVQQIQYYPDIFLCPGRFSFSLFKLAKLAPGKAHTSLISTGSTLNALAQSLDRFGYEVNTHPLKPVVGGVSAFGVQFRLASAAGQVGVQKTDVVLCFIPSKEQYQNQKNRLEALTRVGFLVYVSQEAATLPVLPIVHDLDAKERLYAQLGRRPELLCQVQGALVDGVDQLEALMQYLKQRNYGGISQLPASQIEDPALDFQAPRSVLLPKCQQLTRHSLNFSQEPKLPSFRQRQVTWQSVMSVEPRSEFQIEKITRENACDEPANVKQQAEAFREEWQARIEVSGQTIMINAAVRQLDTPPVRKFSQATLGALGKDEYVKKPSPSVARSTASPQPVQNPFFDGLDLAPADIALDEPQIVQIAVRAVPTPAVQEPTPHVLPAPADTEDISTDIEHALLRANQLASAIARAGAEALKAEPEAQPLNLAELRRRQNTAPSNLKAADLSLGQRIDLRELRQKAKAK